MSEYASTVSIRPVSPMILAIVPSHTCHGMPHLPHLHAPALHAPDHLRSSPTPSAYTPVSLQCTLRKLAQPCHSCGRTKLGSMSNFPRLSPYVSGHRLIVFFSICHICLMHFH